MPDGGLSTLASVVSIAGGIKGLTSSGAGGVQQAADPLSPYRDRFAQLYSGALQPGASQDPTAMPGYSQWKTGVLDPSLEASKRSAAASGMLYSTNEQQNLQKTAQGGYYGFMTDYLNRLAQGSGATANPATAAGMGWDAQNAQARAQMQGLGMLGQGVSGLSGLFGSSGGTPTWGTYGGTTAQGGSADVNAIFGPSGYGESMYAPPPSP